MPLSRTAAAADIPSVLGGLAAAAAEDAIWGVGASVGSDIQNTSPDTLAAGYATYGTAGGLHDNDLFEPEPAIAHAAGNTTTSAAPTAPQTAGLSPMAAFWAAMPAPVWGEPKPAPPSDDDALPPPSNLQPLVCMNGVYPHACIPGWASALYYSPASISIGALMQCQVARLAAVDSRRRRRLP
jgi:hypothetical protein